MPIVLLLGSLHTHYSTIWPVMDPAHNRTPPSRLGAIEGVLRQHEATMTASAVEARQTAEDTSQALAALVGQMQQLAACFSQLSPPAESAPSPGASASAPVREPSPGTHPLPAWRCSQEPRNVTMVTERLVSPFSPTTLFCSPCNPAPFPRNRQR